ncbi:hypothetical protein D6C88_10037, partial [Aureobasidium pullulans]
TGDRVEGNGLYDASNPKGHYTFDVFKHQKLDIITPGNHELYKQNSSNNEFYYTVPNYKDAYIASNLDIYNPKTGKLQPLAQRYRKFATKNQGIRIMAFGFLFNFQGNANNTVVQRVEDTIKEKWFKEAIQDKDIDLFVVAGHVPVSDSHESDAVFKAIRSANWDTPIAFFGGHTHIRDYHKFDKIAYGLESGRYMETIGFMSISGLGHEKKNSDVAPLRTPEFKRRYIDNNLYSLYRHSGKNETTFPTDLGRNVSASISAARKQLNLDHAYGCASRDYWLNRAPYPSESSILTWLENEVLPDTAKNYTKRPQLIITNTGAMRFDIFKGPFTIDTTFLVSPFTSGFHRLKNVPYKAAKQLLQLLNNEGKIMLSEMMVMSAVHRDLGKFTPRALYEQPYFATQIDHNIKKGLYKYPHPNIKRCAAGGACCHFLYHYHFLIAALLLLSLFSGWLSSFGIATAGSFFVPRQQSACAFLKDCDRDGKLSCSNVFTTRTCRM